MNSDVFRAQLEDDLKRFQQLRFEALLQIENPKLALLNYHRADAVVAYLQEWLTKLEKENPNKD